MRQIKSPFRAGRRVRMGAAAAVLGCSALLGTGFAADRPAAAAHASASRTAAPSGLAIGAARRALGARYLVIARAGNVERVAHDLYRVNQARARITAAAAASTSLRRLHAYERLLDAANRPVEQAVRTIRRLLGLPPPPTS